MPPKWATEEDKAKRLKKNREQKAARRKLLQQQESADDKQKRLMHQRQSKAASRERSLSAKRKGRESESHSASRQCVAPEAAVRQTPSKRRVPVVDDREEVGIGAECEELSIESYPPIKRPESQSNQGIVMPAKRPSYAQAAGSLPLRAPFNRSPILDKKWPAYFRPSAGFYPPDASSSPTEAVTNRCVIPIVGLRNTGNTCYINVALQIINFTPEMHEAIESHDRTLCGGGVCCSVRTFLMLARRCRDGDVINPRATVDVVGPCSPDYKRGLQGEASEIVVCLSTKMLENCHFDLFSPFRGRRLDGMTCPRCTKTFGHPEDFRFWQVPFADSVDEAIALDCQASESKDETYCAACLAKDIRYVSSTKIVDAPPCLFIYVKRFDKQPNGTIVKNVKPILYGPHLRVAGVDYRLYYVACHEGETDLKGHWYAFAYDGRRNWRWMNDESTCVVDEATAMAQSRHAVIFLYRRVVHQPPPSVSPSRSQVVRTPSKRAATVADYEMPEVLWTPPASPSRPSVLRTPTKRGSIVGYQFASEMFLTPSKRARAGSSERMDDITRTTPVKTPSSQTPKWQRGTALDTMMTTLGATTPLKQVTRVESPSPTSSQSSRSSRASSRESLRRASLAAEGSDDRRYARLEADRSRKKMERDDETPEKRVVRLTAAAKFIKATRDDETPEQRTVRLKEKVSRMKEARDNETAEQRDARLEADKSKTKETRASETPEQRIARLEADMRQHKDSRRTKYRRKHPGLMWGRHPYEEKPGAFESHACIEHLGTKQNNQCDICQICGADHCGKMDRQCTHCEALFFEREKVSGSTLAKPKFGRKCCLEGVIRLDPLPTPPRPLAKLMTSDYNFRDHALEYNNQFAFTSIGAKINEGLKEGGGPPTYRLRGEMIHQLGSLRPSDGKAPRYAQMYLYEPNEQADIRANDNKRLKAATLRVIQDVMLKHNPYAETLMNARDKLQELEAAGRSIENLEIRMHGDVTNARKRTYNLPSANEVACILVDVDKANVPQPSVGMYLRTGRFQQVPVLSSALESLRFPLIFVYGTTGWTPLLRRVNKENDDDIDVDVIDEEAGAADEDEECADEEETPTATTRKKKKEKIKVTLENYYAYRTAIRTPTEADALLMPQRAGRLWQALLVTAAARMRADRLCILRQPEKQQLFRMETSRGVTDAVADGFTNTSQIGQRIMLPSSFTESPRWYQQKYMDAMAATRVYGRPSLFITVTTNPAWPEILEQLKPGEKASERPELGVRVFRQKLNALFEAVEKAEMFGEVVAKVAVIESQKRGLLHCHIVYTLKKQIETPEEVDEIVQAYFPDAKTQPHIYALVKKHMVHGPCGQDNADAPCMSKGRCQKFFPKPPAEETIMKKGEAPIYRRPNDGLRHAITKGRSWSATNFQVVPTNWHLLALMGCHVNVEVVASTEIPKYLFLYITKGDTRTMFVIHRPPTVVADQAAASPEEPIDEIKEWQEGSYISPPQAVDRIFSHQLAWVVPSVERLAVHDEDNKMVIMEDDEELGEVVTSRPSTLTAWFALNRKDPEARGMLYTDVPCHYVYRDGKWKTRSRLKAAVETVKIGRMFHAAPSDHNRYYLRLLLTERRGATSFEDLRTVDGHKCATWHEACLRLNLAIDDREHEKCMEESQYVRTGRQMRRLFVAILKECNPYDAGALFLQFKEALIEDIVYARSRKYGRRDDEEDVATDIALTQMARMLAVHNRTLKQYNGMPVPKSSPEEADEYDDMAIERVTKTIEDRREELTDEQRAHAEAIIESATTSTGCAYFIDAPGGYGKSHMINFIVDALHDAGRSCIVTASSGVAALELHGGRTAHSAFGIPVDVLDEKTCCNVKKQTKHGRALVDTDLFVLDEAPMMDRFALEAIDRMLQDLTESARLFGGKTFVFSGDFRQVLPVIPRASAEAIIARTIKFSHQIWPMVTQLRLSTNLRAMKADGSDGEEQAKWAQLLLDIGDGHAPSVDPKGDPTIIALRGSMVAPTLDALLDFTFGAGQPTGMGDCAVLAPRNKLVHKINQQMLDRMPGKQHVYISADQVEVGDKYFYTPIEAVHATTPANWPLHELALKTGAPILVLRNLNQGAGVCNGTRCTVLQCGVNSITAVICNGSHVGDITIIPRITLMTDVKKGQVMMERRQFPVRLAFSMSINKAQGQTLRRVGIHLAPPVFGHGQLYVAMSRVRCEGDVMAYLGDDLADDGNQGVDLPQDATLNIVHEAVLN